MNKALASFTMLALSLSTLLCGCNSSTLGLACAADADCEKGQTCYLTGFPGGMCTKGCADLSTSRDCPDGTLCVAVSSNATVSVCAHECSANSDCRGGDYQCRGTSNGQKRACAP